MEFLGNVVPFVDEMPAVHNTRGEEVPLNPEAPTSIYFFKTGVEPHIGEVQSSIWDSETLETCKNAGIPIL